MKASRIIALEYFESVVVSLFGEKYIYEKGIASAKNREDIESSEKPFLTTIVGNETNIKDTRGDEMEDSVAVGCIIEGNASSADLDGIMEFLNDLETIKQAILKSHEFFENASITIGTGSSDQPAASSWIDNDDDTIFQSIFRGGFDTVLKIYKSVY